MTSYPSKTSLAALTGLAIVAFASLSCTTQLPLRNTPPEAQAQPVQQHAAPGRTQTLASATADFPNQPATPTVTRPTATTPKPSNHRSGSVIELTSANFDATIERPGAVVLLDFAADWCGPCRQLAPTIDQVARNFAGQSQVVVARIDVDQQPELSDRYGVEMLPSLLYLKNGQVQKTTVGPASEQEISATLASLAQ